MSLIHYFSKQFSNVFMGSIASFKSSLLQHDVHFLNYLPLQSKTMKDGMLLGVVTFANITTMACPRVLSPI